MRTPFSTKNLKSLPFLLLLAPLVACSSTPKNAYFQDDEGAPHATASGDEQPDNLSQPYVLGTKVNISIRTAASTPTTTWQIRSDNPAVLSVGKLTSSDSFLSAECTATGLGQTTLHAVDDMGVEQRMATVSVAMPDHARVLSNGQLRVLGSSATAAAAAEVTSANILSTSKGVYAILYYQGTTRLYGRGVIQYDPVPQLSISNQTTMGNANNEWLFIAPNMSGSYMINLRLGATPLLALPVLSQPENQLASITLVQQQADSPAADQQIWVLVQALDLDGGKVEGVYSSFTLNGAAQIGDNNNTQVTSGDLYRFNYQAGASMALAATHGSLHANLTLPASKGYVADTTYLGCAMAAGRRTGAGGGALLLFLCAGLIALRRRARPI